MKLAIFYKDSGYYATVLRLFTGLPAYHVAFVDEALGRMWDMHLIRRVRVWPNDHYIRGGVKVELYELGNAVTAEYLNRMLETDTNTYGVLDYALFLFRPIYHLFGKSTRNAKGLICSEMCNVDMLACGMLTPWPIDKPPPSPADLAKWLKG